MRKALKPEFINRIDETIMFMPLGKEAIREIVKIQLLGLEKTLKEKDIYIEFSNEVIDHLSTIGFDPQYGARPVKRVLQKEVMNALSKEILSQRVSIGDHIILDQFDGKFIFRKAKEAIH